MVGQYAQGPEAVGWEGTVWGNEQGIIIVPDKKLSHIQCTPLLY